MSADLSSVDALAALRRLTGRTGDRTSRELRSGKYRLPAHDPSSKRLAEFYEGIRTLLAKARTERARELRSPSVRRDGRSFETVSKMLVDVHPDVARDREYLVDLPERTDHISTTLAGELALALWHELLDAKTSVACRFCRRIRLFADWRKRAQCGDPDCVLAYRQQWKRRHPDLIKRERERRSRARRAKKGTGHARAR